MSYLTTGSSIAAAAAAAYIFHWTGHAPSLLLLRTPQVSDTPLTAVAVAPAPQGNDIPTSGFLALDFPSSDEEDADFEAAEVQRKAGAAGRVHASTSWAWRVGGDPFPPGTYVFHPLPPPPLPSPLGHLLLPCWMSVGMSHTDGWWAVFRSPPLLTCASTSHRLLCLNQSPAPAPQPVTGSCPSTSHRLLPLYCCVGAAAVAAGVVPAGDRQAEAEGEAEAERGEADCADGGSADGGSGDDGGCSSSSRSSNDSVSDPEFSEEPDPRLLVDQDQADSGPQGSGEQEAAGEGGEAGRPRLRRRRRAAAVGVTKDDREGGGEADRGGHVSDNDAGHEEGHVSRGRRGGRGG